MQNGFLSGIIARDVANARAIRQGPEAIALLVIVAVGTSGFEFEHYRERLADLNGRVASQDKLLTEYRTKLTGVEAQIEKLTAALTDAENSVKVAKLFLHQQKIGPEISSACTKTTIRSRECKTRKST
jgi:uncharacterized coiled-coil protein SlyX